MGKDLQKLDLGGGCQVGVVDEKPFDPGIEGICVGQVQKQKGPGEAEDQDDRGY